MIKSYKYIWEQKEIEKLEELFPVKTNRELSKIFGISIRTVIRKARELNLQKIDYFRKTIDFIQIGKLASTHPNSIATRFKKGQRVSPETEFKKGHVPWTKGKSYYDKWKYRKENRLI